MLSLPSHWIQTFKSENLDGHKNDTAVFNFGHSHLQHQVLKVVFVQVTAQFYKALYSLYFHTLAAMLYKLWTVLWCVLNYVHHLHLAADCPVALMEHGQIVDVNFRHEL